MRQWKLIHALADIADAEGDVNAYCAAQQRLGPRVRDGRRHGAPALLDAGRAAEACAIIDAAEPNPAKNEIALADLKIAALIELGRHDEAQALRWEFTRGLREKPLRDLLKRLPDFADVERERETTRSGFARCSVRRGESRARRRSTRPTIWVFEPDAAQAHLPFAARIGEPACRLRRAQARAAGARRRDGTRLLSFARCGGTARGGHRSPPRSHGAADRAP
jgi:hypothetical protein